MIQQGWLYYIFVSSLFVPPLNLTLTYFDLKSETFAKLLLAEKGVFFVPGSCFDKEYYFRLGLAQDSKLFKAGLNELSNFVDEHLIS